MPNPDNPDNDDGALEEARVRSDIDKIDDELAALDRRVESTAALAVHGALIQDLMAFAFNLRNRLSNAWIENFLLSGRKTVESGHPWLLAMLGQYVRIARASENVRNHLRMTYDFKEQDMAEPESWEITIRRRDGKTPLELAEAEVARLRKQIATLEFDAGIRELLVRGGMDPKEAESMHQFHVTGMKMRFEPDSVVEMGETIVFEPLPPSRLK